MRPTRSQGKGPHCSSQKSARAGGKSVHQAVVVAVRQSSRVRKPGRYSELYITDTPRKKMTQAASKHDKADKHPVSVHQVKETVSPRKATKVIQEESSHKKHKNTRSGQLCSTERSPELSKRKIKPAPSTLENSQPPQSVLITSKADEVQQRGRKKKAESPQLSGSAKRKRGAPSKLGMTISDQEGDLSNTLKATPVELIQHLQSHSASQANHDEVGDEKQCLDNSYGEVFTSVAAEISSKILSAIPASQAPVLQQACRDAQATLAGSRGDVKVIYGNWEAILKVKTWLEKVVEENLRAGSVKSANQKQDVIESANNKQSSQSQEVETENQETLYCDKTDESNSEDKTAETEADATSSKVKDPCDTVTDKGKTNGVQTEVSDDDGGVAVMDTIAGVQPAEHMDQTAVPNTTTGVLQQNECTDIVAVLDEANGLLQAEHSADTNTPACPDAGKEVASASAHQPQVSEHKAGSPPDEMCSAEDIESLLRNVGEPGTPSMAVKTVSKADTKSTMTKSVRGCKEGKHQCDECGYKSTYAGLQKHKQRHHSEFMYTCEVCDKSFGIRYDLRRHFMIHLDEKGKVKGSDDVKGLHKGENSLSNQDETTDDVSSIETDVALLLSDLLKQVVRETEGDKISGSKDSGTKHGSSLDMHISGARQSRRIMERAQRALVQSHHQKQRGSRQRGGSQMGMFVCKDCGYRAFTNCGLTKHRHRHHSLYSFSCDICHKVFGIKSDMERHRKVHRFPKDKMMDDETGPVSCKICHKEFRTGKILSSHMFRKHITKTLKCELCDKQFGMECDLQRHVTICHLEADGSRVIRKAARTRKPPKEPQIERPCPHCNKVFNRASSFALHMRIHKEKELLFCEHCPFTTKHRWEMRKHFRRNHQERKFKCERCGTMFREETQLNLHIKRTHLGQKKRMCEFCGKVFISPQVLSTHIKRIHMRIQRFFCDICNKGFYERVRMLEHKEIHKPEEERSRPFTCAYCGRRFARKMDLQQHENTHTGERPYKCSICQKGFAWATEVRKHMVCHSQERPFKCHTCGKAFKLKNKLTTHMITHTQVSKYICSLCHKVFTTMSTLKRHRCKEKKVAVPINISPLIAQEAAVEDAVKEEEIKEDAEEGTTIIAVDTSELGEGAEQDNLTVYMCGICGQVFPDADSIHLHMYEHTGDGVTVVIENTTETGEVETLEEKVQETEGWAIEQEVSTEVQAAATALTDLSGEPAIQK